MREAKKLRFPFLIPNGDYPLKFKQITIIGLFGFFIISPLLASISMAWQFWKLQVFFSFNFPHIRVLKSLFYHKQQTMKINWRPNNDYCKDKRQNEYKCSNSRDGLKSFNSIQLVVLCYEWERCIGNIFTAIKFSRKPELFNKHQNQYRSINFLSEAFASALESHVHFVFFSREILVSSFTANRTQNVNVTHF